MAPPTPHTTPMTVLRVLASSPEVAEPSLVIGAAVELVLELVPVEVEDHVLPPPVVTMMVV